MKKHTQLNPLLSRLPMALVAILLLLAALPLTAVAAEAGLKDRLDQAIEDEYHARSMYGAVLAKFGEVRPFSNIIKAEGRHINALAGLYRQFGWDVPEDPYAEAEYEFATLEEAAQLALDAEIANGALYDELFDGLVNADVKRVFENLQWASLERHLPALEGYLSGEGCPGCGNGKGGGKGKGNGQGGGGKRHRGGR